MASPAGLIKQARRRAGLTQAALAGKLGVTQPVIARLERGGANPRFATLHRVIAATGHELQLELGPGVGIDETMIVADLKLTPDQRLRAWESMYDFARRHGGAALRSSGS